MEIQATLTLQLLMGDARTRMLKSVLALLELDMNLFFKEADMTLFVDNESFASATSIFANER